SAPNERASLTRNNLQTDGLRAGSRSREVAWTPALAASIVGGPSLALKGVGRTQPAQSFKREVVMPITERRRELSDGEELVWAERVDTPEHEREPDPRESATRRRRYALADAEAPSVQES